jgi:hypothetical protein
MTWQGQADYWAARTATPLVFGARASEIKAGSLPDHLVSDPRGKQHEGDRERSDACPRSKACLRATTETGSDAFTHDKPRHNQPGQ